MRCYYDFCFIDARTILLATPDLGAHPTRHHLGAIFLIPGTDSPIIVALDVPSLMKGHHHHSLKLKTDCGRLIGICVEINSANFRDPDSDYLLVIDRPGLLKVIAGSKWRGRFAFTHYKWDEWESRITTILPLENNSRRMAWAVFGRRIVINAEAETLPFTISAVEDENETEDDENDEDHVFEYQEVPCNGERLIVVDFACHPLASVVEAGDASGNILRSGGEVGGLLPGVGELPSEEPPYRSWMERVPSRLPSSQVHMSESMVLVVDVSC